MDLRSRPATLSPRTTRSQRGITLIELLLATAVVAMLLGLGVPALTGARDATHAMQVRTALMASYQAALTSAAMANSRTTLCPSHDGANCIPGIDWTGGWIAFIDRNGDREHQPYETIVSRQGALPGSVHLRSTPGRTRVEVQASDSVAGSNVTFTLCDGRGASHAQALVLSNKSTFRVAPASPAFATATCAL